MEGLPQKGKPIPNRRRSGFTLIEVSIVLVVIGLLVGGVLVGRDLIRAAQYRKVISEVDKFIVGFYTFRGKYEYMPGDFPHATTFWTNCVTEPGVPSNTCNGNGNGTVEYSLCCEGLRAWQHLGLARMLEPYDGYVLPSGGGRVRGKNSPPSAIHERAYYYIYGNLLSALYTSTFQLGGTDGMDESTLGIMSPKDAQKIDKKIDDGLPNMNETSAIQTPGTVTGLTGTKANGDVYSTTCTTMPVPTPPTYNLTTNDTNCVLAFNMK